MRITKNANERKNEILDRAAELFAKQGFDGTSTNDILKSVGIARGTLYYHFPSKEAIMDALIERQSLKLLDFAKAIADDKNIAVAERIFRAVTSLNSLDESSIELMKHMHKPENSLMHQKMQKTIICGLTPILTDIVNEGISQGLFDTPFPYQSVEMIVVYAGTVFDDNFEPLPEEEQNLRIQAFLFNAERIFGAEQGSFVKAIGMPEEDYYK